MACGELVVSDDAVEANPNRAVIRVSYFPNMPLAWIESKRLGPLPTLVWTFKTDLVMEDRIRGVLDNRVLLRGRVVTGNYECHEGCKGNDGESDEHNFLPV